MGDGQAGRSAVHDPAGHLSGCSCSRRSRKSRSSQAKLEQAQTEFAGYSGLFQQKAASAVDVGHLARQPRRRRRPTSGRAGQGRAGAQINLGYTTVNAPVRRPHGPPPDRRRQSGRPGGRDRIGEINEIDPIYAYFTINERDLLRVRAERAKAGKIGRAADQVLELGVADEAASAPGQARFRRHHADRGHGYAGVARHLPELRLRPAARPVRPDRGPLTERCLTASSADRDRSRPGRHLRF